MNRRIQEMIGRKRYHSKLSCQKAARKGNFTFMKKVSSSNKEKRE
jgi:hypothetical protein